MKTKLTVRFWGNPDKEGRMFSLRFDDKQFDLSQREIDAWTAQRGGFYACMDLSRVIIVAVDMIRVFSLSDWYQVGTKSSAEIPFSAKAYGFYINTRKFFQILSRRLEAKAFTTDKYDDRAGIMEFPDISKLAYRYTPPRHLSLMEIINACADPYRISELRKSFSSFARSLNEGAWRRLIKQCSDVITGGGQLYGGGAQEINFRTYGIYGGIILRDDDYSSHT